MSSDHPLPTAPQDMDTDTNSLMNLTLVDPPRWGWTAAGSVADVLPSHERARRKRARTNHFTDKRQKERDTPGRHQGGFAHILPGAPFQTSNSPILDEEQPHSPSVQQQGHDSHSMMSVEWNHHDGVAAARLNDDEVGHDQILNSAARVEVSMQDTPTSQDCDDKPSGKLHGYKQSETQQLGNASSISMLDASERSDKGSTLLKEGMIRPTALDQNGVLDMFTYHRGREGKEPRDSKTGALLCDVEPTDTNFAWTDPRLKVSVTVEFPLQDGEEYCSHDYAEHLQQETATRYKETVEWDLSSSLTPSPMAYALGVSSEFGLSFGQTVDLAVSIQNQLDDYLRSHVTYNAPIAVRDPSGLEREPKRPSHYSLQLYGSVTGEQENSGFHLTKKQRAISRSVYSSKFVNAKPKPVVDDDSGTNHEEVGRTASSRTIIDISVPEIEEEYFTEIKTRAKAETEELVRQLAAEEGKEGGGVLKILESGNCHICHKRSPGVAQFPCMVPAHIYCAQHCKTKFGMVVTMNGGVYPFDYCPICCYTCECIKCLRRLYGAAGELKSLREENGTALEDIVLDNLVVKNKNVQTRSQLAETRRAVKLKKASPPQQGQPQQGQDSRTISAGVVPKIPVSDFPREVFGGFDLDPGTPADYLTVYTSDGSFLESPLGESYQETTKAYDLTPESQEDGNVDYCQQCRIPGNLLCCDFCPRAYHPKCIVPGTQAPNPWECPMCCHEKEVLPEDVVTGQTSLQRICAFLVGSPIVNGFQEGLQVLSIIHEMVERLINYDFGETFAQPVDLLVQGYAEMIKHPMDLGTIRDNLINGTYIKNLCESGGWDEVVIAVLQDIELVWHNCFTFNREGSAIYRMAEVLRRRSLKIRDASFDHLLIEKVKAQLANYVAKCESEREKPARPAVVTNQPQVHNRGNARYKITVRLPKGGLKRPVAVLDPDSGKIVKIYSTMRAAGIAATFLSSNLGHVCEWKNLTEVLVKGIIHRGTSDPTARMFGYRWLLLDDLRGGKVRFLEKKSQAFVEMIDETGSYMFQTIEDALCYAGLPKDIPIKALRKNLSELAPSPEYTLLAGRSWRILVPDKSQASVVNDESSKAEGEADICLLSGLQPIGLEAQRPVPLPGIITVVKEDVVSRRKLAGFESIQIAYFDWLRTYDSSPVSLNGEVRTEDHFRKFYLDGDRNIDGIVWKSATPSGREYSIATIPRDAVESDDVVKAGDVIELNENASHYLETAADNIVNAQNDQLIDSGNTAIPPGEDTLSTPAPENDLSPKNGFHHQENLTNLNYVEDVTSLEETFPAPLSKVVVDLDTLSNSSPGKLDPFENYATELLQTCQTVQLADTSDVQRILKTFR